MTGSPSPAPPPQPRLSVAAAILTCCLAGYAVAVSLHRRSGAVDAKIAAAGGAAVAAALAAPVLLWRPGRAATRLRGELTQLGLVAGEQEARLTEQEKR